MVDPCAAGVAYILKLLDQYQAFDSLHWFRACRAHYAEEKARIQEAAAKERDDDKLQQTVALSLKRVQVRTSRASGVGWVQVQEAASAHLSFFFGFSCTSGSSTCYTTR